MWIRLIGEYRLERIETERSLWLSVEEFFLFWRHSKCTFLDFKITRLQLYSVKFTTENDLWNKRARDFGGSSGIRNL